MNKTLKTVVIVVLAIAFFVFVLLRFVLLLLPRGAFSRIPKSPVDYEFMGTTWTCKEPHIWFESCDDDWGYIGIGEVETEDGTKIPVRFVFELNNRCDIYPESAFWEIGEDGEPHITGPLEDPILECSYEMRKKDTVMTMTISSKDELYQHKYTSLTFYRQDPAGTEESAVQP